MRIIKFLKSCYWSLRAFFDNKSGKFKKSINKCNKALELFPAHHGAHTYKGTALYKLGKYTQALQCYKKAIELQPKNRRYLQKVGFTLFNNIGSTYTKLKKYKAAISSFDKAISLNKNYTSFAGKACIYAIENNKENALKNLKQAIILNPEYKLAAKKEQDFKNLKNDLNFITLIEEKK